MRILLACNDATEIVNYSKALAKIGLVTFFDNGRDAVLSFVNNFQAGNRYDLLVIDSGLKQLDSLEAVMMIRNYESDHLSAPSNNTLIVFISHDQCSRHSHKAKYGTDDRITFLNTPITPFILECIANKVAVIDSAKRNSGISRFGSIKITA